MRVIKISTHETYLIKGRLQNQLVPEGTTFINVDYDANGKVKIVFYNNTNSTRKDYKRMAKEIDKMNSREQTQEEKDNVVGLLKKLSSK